MSRAFEVHVRQWDCGGHRSATACNCGVAAREGGDTVVLDTCNGHFRENRPQLAVKSTEASPHVKILKSYGGRKITVRGYLSTLVVVLLKCEFNISELLMKLLQKYLSEAIREPAAKCTKKRDAGKSVSLTNCKTKEKYLWKFLGDVAECQYCYFLSAVRQSARSLFMLGTTQLHHIKQISLQSLRYKYSRKDHR